MFDHRQQVRREELISYQYEFLVPNLDKLVDLIFERIRAICPQQLHLLWFWHVKNAEVEKKWDDIDEQRDSYDR